MTYESPEFYEFSMDTAMYHMNGNSVEPDRASRCSNSCCFKDGDNW